MKIGFLVLVSSFILLNACGGGGGSSSNNPNDGDDDDSDNNGNGFYFNKATLDGKRIPITKFPATQSGDLLDACKAGMVQFLDQCWDKIHLSDEEIGFKLEKSGEIHEEKTVSDRWYDSLTQVDTGQYFDSIKFKCPVSGEQWCWSSTFYGGTGIRINKDNRSINDLTIHSYFFWGQKTGFQDPYIHAWFVNGTIKLKGKIYNLPITVADLIDAYGEEISESNTKVSTEFGFINFRAIDSIFTDVVKNIKVPERWEDRQIVTIKFDRWE